MKSLSMSSRLQHSRRCVGPILLTVVGFFSLSAWADVTVRGDLTVDDAGKGSTSWSGAVNIVSGSSPQTVNGELDIGGQIPATFFGLDVNGPLHWPSVPFGTLRLTNACSGVGDHLCSFWYDVEPENNQFNWQAFDEWMAALAAHPETTAIYTFTYTPPFAADATCRNSIVDTVYLNSSCPPRQNEDGSMPEWVDFVAQVVNRAKGRIKYYELWNEPNISLFWCFDTQLAPGTDRNGCDSQTNPRKMVRLAQVAYQKIHELDPTAVVLTPSSVINIHGPSCGLGTEWLDAYLAAGGGQWADAIAFHGYLQGCPTANTSDTTPEHVQSAIRNIRNVLDRYGLGSLQIWDTESSWGDRSFKDRDAQAAWVARAYLIRWSAGVQRFAFYGWDFGPFAGELWANGILPAGVAYGELYKWLVGATMTAPCTLSGALWSCPLIRSNGNYRAIVVWKDTLDTDTALYTAPSGYTLYRDLGGAVGDLAGPINVGRKPILVETNPIP